MSSQANKKQKMTDSNSSDKSCAVLFKNGYALISRSITIPAGNTEHTITDIPLDPIHGSLCIVPKHPEHLGVKCASSEDRECRTGQERSCSSIGEILAANVGQEVEVQICEGNGGQLNWMGGVIRDVTGQDARESTPPPMLHPSMQQAKNTALLILDTSDGVTAIPVANVAKVRKPKDSGGELKTKIHADKVVQKQIRVTFNEPPKLDTELYVCYLVYGLTWAPSYQIDLCGENKLHLTFKTVVLNDLDCLPPTIDSLCCVVGFPNMKFLGIKDPMLSSSYKNIGDFFLAMNANSNDRQQYPLMLNNALPHLRSNAMSSMMMMQQQQAILPPSYNNNSSNVEVTNQEVDDSDDSYMYDFEKVPLTKGDRIYLPIFDSVIDYTDVYKWTVEDSQQGTPGEVANHGDVWHAIKFKNLHILPFTTGPVMITRDLHKFLGQDMMSYTPPNTDTIININKALDVKGTFEETQTDTRNQISIRKKPYRVYTIVGKMTITNHKSYTINVVLKKKITGEITQLPTCKLVSRTLDRNITALNPCQTLVWDVEVPAKKSVDVIYETRFLTA